MLPLSLQVPASIVLLAGGVVACFAGFRLFKLVLGIYGFILGALVASSMVGTAETWAMVAAAVAGGALGAVVLVAAYFAGVAVMGAALGAMLVNVGWSLVRTGDPHPVALIAFAAIGALVALYFQRHVIIIVTAFGGAWTMMIGASALMMGKAGRAASASTDVWVVYPGQAGSPGPWVYAAWIALSLVGLYVQLHHAPARKKPKKE